MAAGVFVLPVLGPALGLVLGLVLISVLGLGVQPAAAQATALALAPKRCFAPASDVEAGVVVLPEPRAMATVAQCALLFSHRAESMRFVFESGGGPVRVTPLAPDALEWRLAVTPPGRHDSPALRDRDGAILDEALHAVAFQDDPVHEVARPTLQAHAATRGRVGTEPASSRAAASTDLVEASSVLMDSVLERVATQSVFGCDAPTRSLEIAPPNASTAGPWVVDARPRVRGGSREVALLVDDASEVALSAWATRPVVREGEALSISVAAARPLGVEAPAASMSLAMRCQFGTPLAAEVRLARVRWADGRLEMLSPEVLARSNASVAATARALEFGPAPRGNASVHIVAEIVDERGARWTRSVQMLVRVTERAARIGAQPTATLSEDSRWLDLAIPVEGGFEAAFAACELWAESSRGERLLGWIGGIAEVEVVEGRAQLRIGCEPARVELAKDESLVCRNIRLHERDGFAPLDVVGRAVAIGGEALRGRSFEAPIAGEFGIPGIASIPAPDAQLFAPGVGTHVLALSPGYCSSGNTWPPTHFAQDAWRFENQLQNQSHDQLAVALATNASAFKSYGIVGHSQGGCAALHLYNFYWSGLDWAGPGKLLQAVGSPLRGTPLAGNLAALVEVFGSPCGENYDLTPAGAAAWLSAIPTSSRQKLHTYTTTFIDYWWSYDYCHLVTDPFLSDPEDGTTEHSAGHIPGAINMGLKEGWCHVEGMSHPDQTLDPQRNASMNAETAR